MSSQEWENRCECMNWFYNRLDEDMLSENYNSEDYNSEVETDDE